MIRPYAQRARPYVICHMLPSIDGRIVIRDWNLGNAGREYERTAATFEADAWIIGRISMEPYAGKARVPARRKGEPVAREDFVAAHDASSYAEGATERCTLRFRPRHETVVASTVTRLSRSLRRPTG